MTRLIIILILIVIVSFLLGKLYLLKRQLKNMAAQLQEPGDGFIGVDFVDKDLEAAALCMNKKLEVLQNVRMEATKKEESLKTSISLISHDMRTPLTSVIGYLQLAQKNCTETEVRQNLRVALDRAKYSVKLVDDFFELSVVDSKRYAPVMEKLNLCELVCEEILANCPAFEGKGITPIFPQADGEILVLADRKMLTRVVQNLISNAVHHSTGEMKFSITEGDVVTLHIFNSVSSPVDTEKIFEKFYRSDASRNGDGAGLGLYICRKLVEEMNGSTSATYANGGLTIHIQLSKKGTPR